LRIGCRLDVALTSPWRRRRLARGFEFCLRSAQNRHKLAQK
jgi:hypothetical protein